MNCHNEINNRILILISTHESSPGGASSLYTRKALCFHNLNPNLQTVNKKRHGFFFENFESTKLSAYALQQAIKKKKYVTVLISEQCKAFQTNPLLLTPDAKNLLKEFLFNHPHICIRKRVFCDDRSLSARS